MGSSSISLYSIVRASPNQVSSDLGEEAVILDLKKSVYHGLDATGARIWRLIQQGTSIERIRDALLEEYEVEQQRCQQDVLELVNALAENGLVEIIHEQAA
jgi:hypothetical protein